MQRLLSFERVTVPEHRRRNHLYKTVYINGHELEVTGGMAMYSDIIGWSQLPLRDDYTVTWRDNQGRTGSLVPKEQIWVDEKMVFSVALTGTA